MCKKKKLLLKNPFFITEIIVDKGWQMSPFRWAPMDGSGYDISLGHMAHKARPILADEDPMKDAAKIGEGHFLQAHRPRKTRRAGDGPPDHRMWIVVIPSMHRTADFYRARLKKILAGQPVFCDTVQWVFKWKHRGQENDVRKERVDFLLQWEFAQTSFLGGFFS